MIYEVVGKSEVHYKNQNGQQIDGTRLYLLFDGNNIDGHGCEAVFVGNRVELPPISIGDLVSVLYNRYGKIEAVVKQ